MRTVSIPGGIAKIRDRADLRGRDTKLIKAAAMAAAGAMSKIPDEARPLPGEDEVVAAKRMEAFLREHPLQLTAAEGMQLLDLKEAVVVAYLASWTLEIPLPTLETIGDLPSDIYDALDDATGGEVINAALKGTDFEVNPDQKSPTGPSSSSDSSLRAEESQDQESIRSSPNGTDHSAGEGSSELQRSSTTQL